MSLRQRKPMAAPARVGKKAAYKDAVNLAAKGTLLANADSVAAQMVSIDILVKGATDTVARRVHADVSGPVSDDDLKRAVERLNKAVPG